MNDTIGFKYHNGIKVSNEGYTIFWEDKECFYEDTLNHEPIAKYYICLGKAGKDIELFILCIYKPSQTEKIQMIPNFKKFLRSRKYCHDFKVYFVARIVELLIELTSKEVKK